MRSPLRRKTIRHGAVSRHFTQPAPVGGWNARDALVAMDKDQAIVLENYYPTQSWCETRGGKAVFATGTTGNIKTLAVYSPKSGADQLFAATGSGVYNVSAAGAVGASLAARTEGKHQTLNFGDGTNQYLMMFNGVDKPLYYNGTTWLAVDGATSPALTGLTTTTLFSAFVFKGRLIFLQNDALAFWFLPAGAAGGALTKFDLSALARRGGYLQAGATWTSDSGNGPDDRAVFVTSEGEIIVYEGTDPGTAANWQLVGVFEVGSPLGKRCLTKLGGDLLYLNKTSLSPLSALLPAKTDEEANLAAIIGPAFNESARLYGSNFGWEMTLYPRRAALIVNIPLAENGVHHQYVLNLTTQAWCKFTGWSAETFAVFNDELYYASGTSTFKAWTGFADDGALIRARGEMAYTRLGVSNPKRVTLFRVTLSSSGGADYVAGVNVDFMSRHLSVTTLNLASESARWGSAKWGVSRWGGGETINRAWLSPQADVGVWFSGWVETASKTQSVPWISADYVFEPASAP